MRTKGKKWRIEFIEVTDTGLDLRQNAGVTVGANPAQAPSVGIMGSNVTEVNTSGAKNVIEQQSQVSTKPVGQTTLGQSLSAEQIELLDVVQQGNPLDPEVREAKRKLLNS